MLPYYTHSLKEKNGIMSIEKSFNPETQNNPTGYVIQNTGKTEKKQYETLFHINTGPHVWLYFYDFSFLECIEKL